MKRKNNLVVKPVTQDGPTIRILKRATCPSLSGKSSLAYEVGVTERGEVRLRVIANSGGGTWSNEWQTLDAIRGALDKVPPGKPVSAGAFDRLYSGSSQNSPYFLAAALKHVGMIVPSETQKRCYEWAEPTAFLDEVKDLVAGKVVGDGKPKKGRAKPEEKTAPEVHAKSLSAASKRKKAKS